MKIIQTAELRPDQPMTADHKLWCYNGLDCTVTLEIVNVLLDQLDSTTRQTYAFSLALQGPVLEMSMRGLRVDQSRRAELLDQYRREIKLIAGQLDEIIGDGIGLKINWRSPAQLKGLFYNVLGLPEQRKRNVKGLMAATVGREALEHLQAYMIAEPICIRLLALRDLDKKRGFLETKLDPDGRMRCNFNIAGTNTGRLSSSLSDFGTGGNLQNVDRDLRSIFIADPGKKIANLDLEQADGRNVGAICWTNFVESHGEQFAGSYLDACESGDLHTTVCRMAWPGLHWSGDNSTDKVVAEAIAYRQDSYRQLAKKLGHGTNYYGTPRTMAKHTKVPVKQIEAFQAGYFSGFPCLRAWHQNVKETIRATSQLTTLFGRRRTFFGRTDDDTTLREAIAYAPQSMTADEIDTGIIRLFRANRVELLIQVHDNVVFQFPEELEDEIIPWAKKQLEVHIPLKKDRDFFVPVDAKTGWNWGDQITNKDGTITNVDGLRKWQGSDPRIRTLDSKRSLTELLK